MATSMSKRVRASLAISDMDDQWRHDTAAAIVDIAPTSPLFAIPAVQASVIALGALCASLKADNDTVAAGKAKVASYVDKEAMTRRTFDSELLTLKAVVENNATSAADLTSMGLEERSVRRTKGQALPPEAIDIKATKIRGQFTASAREVGKIRWQYAAEWSPDPVGESTWSTLTGYGKTRKVTGPSGTKVWVRFARLSGQVQSDWSTPVLVTIP